MKNTIILIIVILAGISHADNIFSKLTEMTALYHDGKFEAARAVYARTVAQTNPPPAEIQFNYFRVLLALGDQGEAHRIMQDYVTRKPNDYRPWFEWGVVRTKSCGGRTAIDSLRKAIALNPNHAPSYLWLAQTTISKQEKIEALRKILKIENRDSEIAKQAVIRLQNIED